MGCAGRALQKECQRECKQMDKLLVAEFLGNKPGKLELLKQLLKWLLPLNCQNRGVQSSSANLHSTKAKIMGK